MAKISWVGSAILKSVKGCPPGVKNYPILKMVSNSTLKNRLYLADVLKGILNGSKAAGLTGPGNFFFAETEIAVYYPP